MPRWFLTGSPQMVVMSVWCFERSRIAVHDGLEGIYPSVVAIEFRGPGYSVFVLHVSDPMRVEYNALRDLVACGLAHVAVWTGFYGDASGISR